VDTAMMSLLKPEYLAENLVLVMRAANFVAAVATDAAQ